MSAGNPYDSGGEEDGRQPKGVLYQKAISKAAKIKSELGGLVGEAEKSSIITEKDQNLIKAFEQGEDVKPQTPENQGRKRADALKPSTQEEKHEAMMERHKVPGRKLF